jgi:hypothetical protein
MYIFPSLTIFNFIEKIIFNNRFISVIKRYKMNSGLAVLLVIIVFIIIIAIYNSMRKEHNREIKPESVVKCTDKIRTTMNDFIHLSHLYVHQKVNDYKGCEKTKARLYRNRSKLANCFSEIFGYAVSDKYNTLLRARLDCLIKLVNCKTSDMQKITVKLHQCNEELVDFYCRNLKMMSRRKMLQLIKDNDVELAKEAGYIIENSYDDSLENLTRRSEKNENYCAYLIEAIYYSTEY